MIPPFQQVSYDESTSGSPRSSPNDTQTLSLGCSTSISGSKLAFGPPANRLNFNDPVPEEAPLASGLLEAAKKIQENCK